MLKIDWSHIMKNKYLYEEKEKLIEDIKKLRNYEGYIQFSDTKIRACDLFQKDDDIATKIEPTKGFIYEAHFYNEITKTSIAIKQLNGSLLVSETVLTDEKYDVSYEEYISDIEKFSKIRMAQIWEAESDTLCEDMKVKKLQKVIFAGFESKTSSKQKEQKVLTQKRSLYETLDEAQKEKLLKHFLTIFQPEYIDSLLKEEQ